MAKNFYQRVKKDIQKLKAEKIRLEKELAEVNDALGVIGEYVATSKKLVATLKPAQPVQPAKKKSKMSAKARKAIGLAKAKWWADRKKAKK